MSVKTSGWSVVVAAETFGYLASPTECVRVPLTRGAYERPAYILDRVAALMYGSTGGVLVLDGPGLRKTWGGLVKPAGIGRVALADEPAWTATVLEPWTTWRRKGAPAIHVAFLDEVQDDRAGLMPAGGDLGTMARRLAWYADRIGGAYLMTPGVAGHGAIRAAFRKPGRGQQPYWGARDWRLLSDDDAHQGVGDLMWKRAPTRTEVDMGWVHSFDLNAARLSALGVVEVPYGKLEHTGPCAFDATRAGYWQIYAHHVKEHKRHPPLVDTSFAVGGLVEVTTPIMSKLMDRGALPEVVDSWTSEGRRLFRGLAEQWNRARLEAMDLGRLVELGAVKATYREAAGLFAKRGGSIWRPEWYHTAMDRQRVTVINHVERIAQGAGRRPLAIHTDCLWYASTHADPRQAAGELGIMLGTGLGTFRVHSCTPSRVFFKVKEGAK